MLSLYRYGDTLRGISRHTQVRVSGELDVKSSESRMALGNFGEVMDTNLKEKDGRRCCPEGQHAFVSVMLESCGWYRVVRVCMRCGYISKGWSPDDILVADGPGIGRLIRAEDCPGMRVVSVPSFKVRYLPKEHEWR